MDEFATKPVTSQELAAIIARVCEDTHDVFDASPPPQPADTTLFFDPVIFAQFADEIGASAANRIAGVFLRDTWERLATMRGKRGDAAELAREAHAIKSAAATFGLTRLSSLAAQLEKTASSLSDDEVEALVAAMEGSFVHAQERLELAAA
jgi:HPt (histidine-containing phosphotransfer) domain-containing protein